MALDSPHLAPTPPCGWNSFDCFGTGVLEHEVLANAEILARDFLPAGFDTVVVDGGWYHPESLACTNANQAHEARPYFAMDLEHRLTPAPERFPSAAGGAGFKPLADQIHSMGLKFGIHIMRGFPRQAMHPGYPTRRGKLRPVDIANPECTCSWMNHMYGVRTDHPSGQAYYNSILDLYASWGVDFLKADDFTSPYHSREIEMIDLARRQCGRPITLSLSPGACSLDQANHVAKHAEMWRLAPDFWDIWEHLRRAFDLCRDWSEHRAPGTWPDPDMLPIGRLSRRGPAGPEHESFFTPSEQRSLLALWSIFQAPMFIGGDLTVMDAATISLVSHPGLIRIRRGGNGGRCITLDDQHSVWTSVSADGRTTFAAIFNFGEVPAELEVPSDLHPGNGATTRITDLWKGGPGYVTNSSTPTVTIASHDVAILALENAESASPDLLLTSSIAS